MAVPAIALSNKHSIPQIGLGLWQIKDMVQFNAAFEAAVKAGYRHFDSAQIYGNEQLLGNAWQESGLSRQDIFLTTKITVYSFGYHRLKKSFAVSLEKLQTDYVDLLLLHFPVPLLRKKSWQALEEIQATGGAKSIGVSNYTVSHLEKLKQYAKVMPAVNQVELHIFLQQPELVEYCQANNIALEAYSPLAHSRRMDDAIVTKIAKKHHKSYAQIMLRWCVERGFVVLPKSVTPSRIQENMQIFDFKLDADDMTALTKQNRNLRTCLNPTHVP